MRFRPFNWRYSNNVRKCVLMNFRHIFFFSEILLTCCFQEKKLVAEIKKTAKTGNEASLFSCKLVFTC